MTCSRSARREPTARAPAPAPARAALAVAGLLAAAASPVPAAEFTCAVEGDRRHLRVALPGAAHLCEVVVDRLDAGERRVVWYADNDSAFCAERIEDLAGKYESDWGFECTRWPDASGVDALGSARRAALDAEILERRAALARGERIVGVRVERAGEAPGTALESTEFFVRGASGRVRTALRLERGGRALFATEDLAGELDTGGDAPDMARIDALGTDATLRVATELADAGRTCRGVQTLRVGADGRAVATVPHRFACDPELVSDADAAQ